jgi:hypothetical protein
VPSRNRPAAVTLFREALAKALPRTLETSEVIT